jgi:hypothetical protein
MKDERDLNPDEVNFPALALSGPIAHVYFSWEQLTRCTSQALKNGWFKNLVLIDSSGRQFRLSNARKIGPAGPLWGFHPFGRRVRIVPLITAEASAVTLSQVKVQVSRTIAADRAFWSSGGALEALESDLASASSTGAVIGLLAKIGGAA